MATFVWRRAIASLAVAGAVGLGSGACGSHTDRVKTLSAPTSVQARIWGEKAGTALSVMRGFLDSMGTAVTIGPVSKEKFMAMCATAMTHLPDLEAAVGPAAPQPEL